MNKYTLPDLPTTTARWATAGSTACMPSPVPEGGAETEVPGGLAAI